MPDTHFDPKLQISGDVLRVTGTLSDLEPGEEPPREVLVFAFVTQQQAAHDDPVAKTVTLTGDSRLTPVNNPTGPKKWWHVLSDSQREKVKGWRFDVRMPRDQRLVPGWAFGTAVRLTFEADNTIETYSWSGWVQIEEVATFQ
jgi:hypothetical protein